jgi:Uma2 family endonuclease
MPTIAARQKKRSAARDPEQHFETLQDVLDYVGVSADRVVMHPRPGTATQRDLLNPKYQPLGGIVELVDGILVQKVSMGFSESQFAMVLAGRLFAYLEQNNIGAVTCGGDAYLKLKPRQIRIPDVSFIRWDAMPGRRIPKEPCPELIADLVVEILSRKNTRKEMERKRQEFFDHGTKLFWIVDPRKEIVTVYHSVNDAEELGLDDSVDGEDVLPGFHLSIRTWFELAETGMSQSKRPKKS